MSEEIQQNNGRIVMQALEFLEQPETMANVVKYIAKNTEVDVAEVKEPIERTLIKGVKYGFIQKNGSRYGIPRTLEPEQLAAAPDRRGSMQSRSTSKGRSRSRSKPNPNSRGRSRTTSRGKSTAKSRGRSMSAKASARNKGQKSTPKKGRMASKGKK